MSDNTRREAAFTDPSHQARRHHRPQRLRASRGGTWPDARTAELLLSGKALSREEGGSTPPNVSADRLLRLLAAAHDGHAPIDPAREAVALAAFRTAAARRAREGGTGSRLAALRAAFAVRRPRVMAAAVVSALCLGGVAVGMAAAAITPGGGGGTGPIDTRPPAAVSPDGGTAGPWTAGPAPRRTAPAAPPARSGAGGKGHGAGRHEGNAKGHSCRPAEPGHCPQGHGAGKDAKSGQAAPRAGRGRSGGTPARRTKAARPGKPYAPGGPRRTRHGRRPPSRAPGG